LDGEFDSDNCYLEIHPGAGGTEAMDWASMLLRMYQMYFDKKGYKYEVVDYQAGDEAGVKSVMLHITNPYAYGYLKSEIGVHRLVRISPFNAAGKRQTSFAAVNVTPEIDDIPKDIEVNEEDIRWDITRASGNGGQGVNTTDSAVRLSHIPTGIVIYAQQERSQLRNKETAMKILKSKLYQLEVEKRNNAINSLKGSDDINFGSQIRNYVLEPYKLVKDLRTNYETSQADKVLDGDIDAFIEAYLRMKRD
jgi:peptide chain release factor 2